MMVLKLALVIGFTLPFICMAANGEAFIEVKWHCLNSKAKNYRVLCEDYGRHETEGPKGFFSVNYLKSGVRHTFVARHAEPVDYCVCKANRIRKIIKTSEYFCIQGEILSPHESDKEHVWTFLAARDQKGNVAKEDELCD